MANLARPESEGAAGPSAVDHRDPGLVATSVSAFASGSAHSRARHAARMAAGVDATTTREYR
jgi:hypothetical protein